MSDRLPKLVAIGGQAMVTLYCHEGYERRNIDIADFCRIAKDKHIVGHLFLLAGDPMNPARSWPLYALVDR